MSTTDTRAEQIKALAQVIFQTLDGDPDMLPWEAQAETLLDGPVAAMIAQAERAAAAKAWGEGVRACIAAQPWSAPHPDANPYRADRIEGDQ